MSRKCVGLLPGGLKFHTRSLHKLQTLPRSTGSAYGRSVVAMVAANLCWTFMDLGAGFSDPPPSTGIRQRWLSMQCFMCSPADGRSVTPSWTTTSSTITMLASSSSSLELWASVLDNNNPPRLEKKNKTAQSNWGTGHVIATSKISPSPCMMWTPSTTPMYGADPTHHSKPQLRRFMHFHTATSKTPHWLHWGAPHSPPKITPSDGPIPKPSYLPHPWTNPSYHPKPHPYPISHFATMHWTDTQTNRWLERMFDDYRPLSLYREGRRGLTTTRNHWHGHWGLLHKHIPFMVFWTS